MDDAKKKIVPASVLCLAPEAAAALTADLDEPNRAVLAAELARLALAGPLPAPKARVLGAVFGALGRARLKLHAWSLLTDRAENMECVKAVHPYVAPVIVALFGVPFGEAGIGVAPQMGATDEDRQDLAETQARDFRGFGPLYAEMVAAARAAGTLVVAETV